MSVLNKETIMNFYNLKNLVRYNHRFRLVNETVAEHSYFVSLFTMIICDELEVETSTRVLAMEHAIIHDIPEILISDVPYPVKEQSEELKEALKKSELKAMDKLIPTRTKNFDIIENDDTLEIAEKVRFIVKLSDILSVYQYCMLEKSLGNTHMKEVEELTIKRLCTMEHLCDKIFPGKTFPIYLKEIINIKEENGGI